jgi:hypothetical protein
MARLSEATSAGVAVLLVHHQRKAGGEEGDAVRDSNAFLGAVDVLIELERPDDANAPDNQRHLVAVGRWPATPRVLMVERHPDGAWYNRGEATSRADVKHRGLLARLLGELPDEWATEPEIAEAATGNKEAVGNLLRELYREGLVVRSGAGKSGAPYLYRKSPPTPPGEGTGDGGESTTNTSQPLPRLPIGDGEEGEVVRGPGDTANGHSLAYGDLSKFDWGRRR